MGVSCASERPRHSTPTASMPNPTIQMPRHHPSTMPNAKLYLASIAASMLPNRPIPAPKQHPATTTVRRREENHVNATSCTRGGCDPAHRKDRNWKRNPGLPFHLYPYYLVMPQHPLPLYPIHLHCNGVYAGQWSWLAVSQDS